MEHETLKGILIGLAKLAQDHQKRIQSLERALTAVRTHLNPVDEQKVDATIQELVVRAGAFGQHPDETTRLIASVIQYIENS